MPFYKFYCQSCDKEEKILLSKKELDSFVGECRQCGRALVQTYGRPESRSMETLDEYKGKKAVSDVGMMLEKRSHDHFVKEDLPKIIAERGIDYAKKNGFVDEDGKPV